MLVGVVVLYNPQNGIVIKNIESYLEYVEKLLIVDNSESINEEIVKYFKLNRKVYYQFLGQNMGIAHALNKGIEFAKHNDANMLLTMDQDSKFKKGEFEKMIDFLNNQSFLYNDAVIFSPHHNVPYLKKDTKVERVRSVMTSGNIIMIKKLDKIGYFNEDLFIDSVDHEMCFRINKLGYGVYRINHVTLEHNLGELKVKKFFKKKIYVTNHNYIRRYYITRNLLYVVKKYSRSKIGFLNFLFVHLICTVLLISLYESDKFLKYKSIIKGVIDFKRGNLGKKYL